MRSFRDHNQVAKINLASLGALTESKRGRDYRQRKRGRGSGGITGEPEKGE